MSVKSQHDRETPKWIERELVHSRHVIGNAKVVVTFSATARRDICLRDARQDER